MTFVRPTREQSRDTGMALVLALLLAQISLNTEWPAVAAAAAMVITMTIPAIWWPLAVLWFGCAAISGAVMSRVLLTIVFVVVVIPMGLVLQLLGKDPMRLRQFRRDRRSVMVVRDHPMSARDLVNPY
jgi:hypothetical protein